MPAVKSHIINCNRIEVARAALITSAATIEMKGMIGTIGTIEMTGTIDQIEMIEMIDDTKEVVHVA
jgi:hypothetical protein